MDDYAGLTHGFHGRHIIWEAYGLCVDEEKNSLVNWELVILFVRTLQRGK